MVYEQNHRLNIWLLCPVLSTKLYHLSTTLYQEIKKMYWLNITVLNIYMYLCYSLWNSHKLYWTQLF